MCRFFTAILLILTLPTAAQIPVVEWYKTYGGSNGEEGTGIEATTDGGFITAGYAESFDGDVVGRFGLNLAIADGWVTKYTATGELEWQKCLIGKGNELFSKIKQTPDGGYVFSGYTTTKDCNTIGKDDFSMDYLLVKLSPSGEILWQKTFGGSKNDYSNNLTLTQDGGFLIVGYAQSADGDLTTNAGQEDFWAVKINGSGSIQWQKSFGGSGFEEATSVIQTQDGDYVIAGFTESKDGDVLGNHGMRDCWILKLDPLGSVIWKKCIGGSMNDEAQSILETSDRNLIFLGQTNSSDGDISGAHQSDGLFADFLVVQLDKNGSILWQKCYGGRHNEFGYNIRATPDGGYILGGEAESDNGDLTCNKGYVDIWVLKIDHAGSILWQKSLGGFDMDRSLSIIALNNDQVVIAGLTCSNNVPGWRPANSEGTCGDLLLIKLSVLPSVPAPTISINPATVNICPGIPTTISTNARYTGLTPIYSWTKNGLPVGGNSPTYTASDLLANDLLSCTVISESSCSGTPQIASDEARITVKAGKINPAITISASSNFVCGCTPITLTAIVANGGQAPVYGWKVNDRLIGVGKPEFTISTLLAGDIVTCIYSDQNSCIDGGFVSSNSIIIQEDNKQPATISISTPETTICAGNEITFTAITSNAGASPVYQWQLNGINTGPNSKIFTTSNISDHDKITCRISTDPTSSCVSIADALSNEIELRVNSGAVAAVSISSSDPEICVGETMSFKAVISNSGSNSRTQWTVNGINANNSTLEFKSDKLANGDKIICTLFPGAGACSTLPVPSNEIITMVHPLPIVQIEPSDITVLPGETVQFVTTISGSPTNFTWTPANKLEDPSSSAPLTKPITETTSFTLAVTSDKACKGIGTAIVRTNRKLQMPNAFSPNGDGKNDVFKIPAGVSIRLEAFIIFNRWGDQVFSTKSISEGWNGTQRGKKMPVGNYVYIIRGTDEKGPINEKGSILLTR